MPTIVDDYVDTRVVSNERCPKCSVALIPDRDPNTLTLEARAVGLYVDPVYRSFGSEIVAPQGEAAAPVNPYLKEVNLLAPKWSQMTIIYVEEVSPFKYPWPTCSGRGQLL
jgi:hypothetical protein